MRESSPLLSPTAKEIPEVLPSPCSLSPDVLTEIEPFLEQGGPLVFMLLLCLLLQLLIRFVKVCK
jgi:hypothetical protein